MCDDDSLDDMIQAGLAAANPSRQEREWSRRRFGALSLGLASLLPTGCGPAISGPAATTPMPNALKIDESEVTIKTADGSCDAYFAHPNAGTHPAVLVWPDILGLRPAFRQMGKRLA